MKDLIYTEHKPFKIRSKDTDWGVFFFTRLIWAKIPEDGKWFHSSLFITFQLIITAIAIVADVAVMAVEYLFIKLALLILTGIWDLIKLLFQTVINKFLGKVFGWVAVIAVLFISFSLYKSGQWQIILKKLEELFSLLL